MSKKQDELLDSDYDGIQEYDNSLPRWWLTLFYLSIVFSVIYVAYYHVLGWGALPRESLVGEMQELESLRASVETLQAAAPATDLKALVANPAVLAVGNTVFQGKCASCHGALGQGIVGPNLTDDYWIHGGTLEEIKQIILQGVLEKGMLAWKDMLSADEVDAVTAYVYSMHGTAPEGAKEPQGELVTRE